MAADSEGFVEKIGHHVARFEPPDLFHLKFVGDLSAEELLNVSQVLKRATGKFYIAMETTEMGSFTSGAKKVIREVPLAAGIAIFGASRQMQLVLSILNKVYMMVNLGKDIKLTFVSTEEEARRWIEYLRQGKG